YAEESYGVLERRFTHHVQRRVPLIIYASHTDFEQTNVLPFVPPEGLLGVTEFLKRRVALPFTGSYSDFRHTIRHELVHVFQLSLVAEVFRRYPRIRHAEPPLWWSEGLAEFFSAGEDSRDQMILRDLTLSGRLPTLRELAYAAGDSAGGILYFSPSTGYTNIYAQSFAGGRARAVVKGERTAEFESFHFFESRLDVSPAGVVVFSSRYLDRDAVFFWSLPHQR